MNSKIINPLFFVFSFLLLTFIYWPSLNGTPIWDDNTFWFQLNILKPSSSYLELWRNSAWAFSLTIQKAMLSLFDKKYYLYHSVSLLLHFINSYLVYRLGRYLRIRYQLLFFLLFLLHPTAVITTAWMVQIKTLLCMLFALLSFFAYLKGEKNKRWMILSWAMFLLSVFSKSSSIFLPIILLFLSYKKFGFKKIHLLVPFFIISSWGAYRVLVSPVTVEASQNATEHIKVKENYSDIDFSFLNKTGDSNEVVNLPIDNWEPTLIDPSLINEKPLGLDKKKEIIIPAPEVTPTTQEKPSKSYEIIIDNNSIQVASDTRGEKGIVPQFDTILQTLNYYFWQTVMPLNVEPVKGLNIERAHLVEYIHIVFVIILLTLFWKTSGFIYLLIGHLFLLPYLGIVPAPFMNVSWVSDQHLYLALPFFMAFWIKLVEKIKWDKRYIVIILFISFYSYKSWKEAYTYKNQTAFFKRSLEYNPYNIPIVYNLAYEYIFTAQFDEAYDLLDYTIDICEARPGATKNKFFPYLKQLHLDVKSALKK